jgi:hypothetical protein
VIIDSVFLHLLENPTLCDRSAVEMSVSVIWMSGRRSDITVGEAKASKYHT